MLPCLSPGDTHSVAVTMLLLSLCVLSHRLNATSLLLFSGGCSDALHGIYGEVLAEVDGGLNKRGNAIMVFTQRALKMR